MESVVNYFVDCERCGDLMNLKTEPGTCHEVGEYSPPVYVCELCVEGSTNWAKNLFQTEFPSDFWDKYKGKEW